MGRVDRSFTEPAMKALLLLVGLLITLSDVLSKRMGGGGGYRREDQSYYRRRPWEVGYYSNRNNPRKYWESSWRRQNDIDHFIVKTERPYFEEMEEIGCIGLCLIKKLEKVNAELKKKKERKETTTRANKIFIKSTTEKKQGACTGMC